MRNPQHSSPDCLYHNLFLKNLFHIFYFSVVAAQTHSEETRREMTSHSKAKCQLTFSFAEHCGFSAGWQGGGSAGKQKVFSSLQLVLKMLLYHFDINYYQNHI